MFILQVSPTPSPTRNTFVLPAVTMPGFNLMQNANNPPPPPSQPNRFIRFFQDLFTPSRDSGGFFLIPGPIQDPTYRGQIVG